MTGFEMGEIDLILEESGDAKGGVSGPEDQVPDLAEAPPVSRAGDLWALGAHRLLCGNALEGDSYGQVLGPERAEIVVTDPPFNVPIKGHVCGSGSIQHREFALHRAR